MTQLQLSISKYIKAKRTTSLQEIASRYNLDPTYIESVINRLNASGESFSVDADGNVKESKFNWFMGFVGVSLAAVVIVLPAVLGLN
ncbi:hypothetical protein LRR81_08825 [Metabacillus sp. GX 13764]|uniref:hypothetical protein n=1 Tax=Metabacillus kandeliae TaxID=2900151 RepID=UPI001E382A07|nr:hypothetical protein [Metabacillus kandeliae]MCD7034337.1 hypothetical protein [Metabacillus kandeliae]